MREADVVTGTWERVSVPELYAPSVAGPGQRHGVQESRGREGAARAAPLHERSRSPASCQLRQGLQGHSYRLKGGWQTAEHGLENPVTSWGSVTMFLPSGPVFLGCALRARTGPAVCCRNGRGLLAELSGHLQRSRASKHVQDPSPPPPIAQQLGRSVLPRKRAHG